MRGIKEGRKNKAKKEWQRRRNFTTLFPKAPPGCRGGTRNLLGRWRHGVRGREFLLRDEFSSFGGELLVTEREMRARNREKKEIAEKLARNEGWKWTLFFFFCSSVLFDSFLIVLAKRGRKKEREGEKSGERNSRGTSAKKRRYIVLFCSCLFLRIAFQIFFFRSVEGNNGKADFPNETFSASFHIFRVQRREGGETKRAKSCDKRNHVRKNSRWIPSLHFSSSEPGALDEAKYKK